jgi:hypothetical protein
VVAVVVHNQQELVELVDLAAVELVVKHLQ